MTATDTYSPNRILELEAWLDRNSITWELVDELPVDEIDHIGGLANQARLQPLDEEVVDRYAADMEAGALFPPIILRRAGCALIPVGGNHRTAAARKAKRPTLPAYLVDVDDEHAHLLAIEDNRRHGLPLSDEERLYHAVQLANGGKHTAAEAAKICGLTTAKLQTQLAANKGAARAIHLDVDGWAALSTTARAKCGSINNDSLFARVVPLVANGSILSNEIADIVSRINTAEWPKAVELVDALELDSRQRTRRTRGHPVSKVRAPATRLLHDLDGIMNFDPAEVAADCRTPEQRARVANQIKAAARRLMAIETGLWT